MAAGLLADMRQGKRVLYLGPDRGQTQDALDTLVPLLRTYETSRRRHGYEQVESPPAGGCVRLSSVGSSSRGLTVDVVVIDADPTTAQMEELAPLLITGEVIRA